MGASSSFRTAASDGWRGHTLNTSGGARRKESKASKSDASSGWRQLDFGCCHSLGCVLTLLASTTALSGTHKALPAAGVRTMLISAMLLPVREILYRVARSDFPARPQESAPRRQSSY